MTSTHRRVDQLLSFVEKKTIRHHIIGTLDICMKFDAKNFIDKIAFKWTYTESFYGALFSDIIFFIYHYCAGDIKQALLTFAFLRVEA